MFGKNVQEVSMTDLNICERAAIGQTRRSVRPGRGVVVAAITVIVLPLATLAARAETSCFTIADPDQRAYCRALHSHSSGDCIAIVDIALRTTCMARFGGGKPADVCNSPSLSSWEREKCKEAARR